MLKWMVHFGKQNRLKGFIENKHLCKKTLFAHNKKNELFQQL